MDVNKNVDFFINIGTYKPKYFLIRLFLISAVGVVLVHIAKTISGVQPYEDARRYYVHFLVVFGFNSVSEINLLVMSFFGKFDRFRWKIYPQILAILAISALLIYFWINIATVILGEEGLLQNSGTQIILILGLFFLIIHLLFIVISNLTKEWIDNRQEIEELKQAKLQGDYNSLKDRLNPHFLFNNLSVLKSLIHYSPADAEVFTQNFTNVYRYVLTSHEKKTITLKKELDFLQSYIALHKERISDGLVVDIHIEKDVLQKELPPMAIQLLVENAIKHNIANKNMPLRIEIYSENTLITVKNNLNKKDITYSTQTGLNTLKTQYKLIANKEVEVIDDGKYYLVKIPLL